MNVSYVVSVVIGFVLVVAFYLLRNRREAFTDTAVTATPTSVATSTSTSLTLQLKTLPLPDKAVMYTELFDTNNLRSGTSWMADIPSDNSKSFSINAPSGSVNINGGLAMNGTTLVGPSSDLFTLNTDFSLSSFSVAFFGRLNNLDSLTDPTTRIILWSMFAEARPQIPNIIEIALEGLPPPIVAATTPATATATTPATATAIPTSVIIRMTVGVDSTQFTIPKSTLLTGENALYTFTYDNSGANPIFSFFVNKAAPMTFTFTTNSHKIYLGNTNMILNPNTTGLSLDMGMLAFIYYTAVLTSTDQSNLMDYFMQEANGISVLVKSQLFDKAAMSSNVNQLKTSLNICHSKLQATDLATALKNPWHVTLDETAAVSAAALSNMYSANVHAFGSSNVQTTASVSSPQVVRPPLITTAFPADYISTIVTGNTSNTVLGQNINDPAFWNMFMSNIKAA